MQFNIIFEISDLKLRWHIKNFELLEFFLNFVFSEY